MSWQKVLISYPASLPVSERQAEILTAIQQHQVVIICGETGSGKTTQLPKMLLSLQQQAVNNHSTKPKLIGHTQPRRIAATSVAKRIAQELNSPLGEVVGYKIRFQDKLQPNAVIKLMTDGILLAETQNDPLLKTYSAIIIDEAHERSLNIDFLLGYLKQILPQRPDLKIIVTSATIDANRFAQHFTQGKKPAPVLMVSGRLYPVELRYRAWQEEKDYGLNQAISDAVDELWHLPNQSGDILVFLPGEREIKDVSEHLLQHLSQSVVGSRAEVIPLFARLSQTDQERIFQPSGNLRIILATNVAETSLTVPGIRYVIDSGLARVKRYSYRSKVELLQIEKISQAAANQRAGRCGRVANGICIRLYDEVDFNLRAAFTDPEIMRSSLTAVILRMKALKLSDIEKFPFIEMPQYRAITDGYQQLQELGAITAEQQLNSIGYTLAKLPIDPRFARILLEAHKRQALQEALIITSALSVQDVRDRPLEHQAKADQAHAKFKDSKSEFVSYLKLWNWLHDSRGDSAQNNRLTNREYDNLLRSNYINARRAREWRDVYRQLNLVIKQQKWQLNTAPASYEQLHLALLTGLLGNIGCKSEQEDWFLGAHSVKFYIHPSSALKFKKMRWIMVAEQVSTTRLYGRTIAAIEPAWLEQIGAHLIRTQVLDPHWERKAGKVIALQQATLYGVTIYRNRRISYENLDPLEARTIFIRQALLSQDIDSKLPFLANNQKVIAQIEQIEHKSRRQDVLVDDELIYAFYERYLPNEICNQHQLEQWYHQAAKQQPNLLYLDVQELKRHQAKDVTNHKFPRYIRLGGIDCKASYWYEPGHIRDGLTIDVPVYILNQIDEQRCDWLVPGLLQEKLQILLKSIPQKMRGKLSPLAATSKAMFEDLIRPETFAKQDLKQAMVAWLAQRKNLNVKTNDFKTEMLEPHLLMNFKVINEKGRFLTAGRSLAALKQQYSQQARGAFQQLINLKLTQQVPLTSTANNKLNSTQAAQKTTSTSTALFDSAQLYTSWDFGELTEIMEIKHHKQLLIGYPALTDKQTAVAIELFDDPQVAQKIHRQGLFRLCVLQIKDVIKHIKKNLAKTNLTMQLLPFAGEQEINQQIIHLAIEKAFLSNPLPTNKAQFSQCIEQGRSRINLIVQEIVKLVSLILTDYTKAQRKLKEVKPANASVQDMQQQLQRLMPNNFLTTTNWATLQHYPRYLKGIVLRLEKLSSNSERDLQRTNELRVAEQRYWRLLSQRQGSTDAKLQEYRWMLEEQRISFFAQELRTPYPISLKRLDKLWLQISH